MGLRSFLTLGILFSTLSSQAVLPSIHCAHEKFPGSIPNRFTNFQNAKFEEGIDDYLLEIQDSGPQSVLQKLPGAEPWPMTRLQLRFPKLRREPEPGPICFFTNVSGLLTDCPDIEQGITAILSAGAINSQHEAETAERLKPTVKVRLSKLSVKTVEFGQITVNQPAFPRRPAENEDEKAQHLRFGLEMTGPDFKEDKPFVANFDFDRKGCKSGELPDFPAR